MRNIALIIAALATSQPAFAACGLVLVTDVQSLAVCVSELNDRIQEQAAAIEKLRGRVNYLELIVALQSQETHLLELKSSHHEDDIQKLKDEVLELKLRLPVPPKRR